MAEYSNSLFDSHIHIGQFKEIYYYPWKVIQVLDKYGVKGAYVSSTTSCIDWDDQFEKKYILNHIGEEFDEFTYFAEKLNFDARPLCWIIPRRFLEGDSIEQIMNESHYAGFKIHPRAHRWDVKNDKICMLMDEICEYADLHNLPVWIHTGLCDFESPLKFEKWYKTYPNVVFVMAHCKAECQVLELFKKYDNVYGDVAFFPVSSMGKFIYHGYGNRLLFGTDFPITTSFDNLKYIDDKLLYENYNQIINEWRYYMPFLGNIDNVL